MTCFLFLLIYANFVFAESFLFIGDSHTVGSFGNSLQKKLSGSNEVYRFAVSGSATLAWVNQNICTPKLGCIKNNISVLTGSPQAFPNFSDALSQIQKTSAKQLDNIIIALGTNDINKNCKSFETLAIEKITRAAKANSKMCFWIGPPKYQDKTSPIILGCRSEENYNLAVTKIKAAVENLNCSFIDSRQILELTDPKNGYVFRDKVHFTPSGGELWAQKVYEQIEFKKKGSGITPKPLPSNKITVQ